MAQHHLQAVSDRNKSGVSKIKMEELRNMLKITKRNLRLYCMIIYFYGISL